MRCELVTSFAQLEKLKYEWDRLWKMTSRQDVYSSFFWTKAIWKTYGHRRSICTPVVWMGNRIVAILPLAVENKIVRFLGSPHADVHEFLIEPGVSKDVVANALRTLEASTIPWRKCVFDNIPDESDTHAALDALQSPWSKRLLLSAVGVCPFLELQSIPQVTAMQFCRKRHLRQLQNRLHRDGELVFRMIDDPEEVLRHLPAFFDQHISRWAQEGIVSKFTQQEPCAFAGALVEELGAAKMLRFAVLELDQRVIAYHFGMWANGRSYYYKPSFDLRLRNRSPGQVLLGFLIENSIRLGDRFFDLGLGNEPYKQRFSNRISLVRTLEIERNTLRALVRRNLNRAKSMVRESPCWSQMVGPVKQWARRFIW